jgi:hypothetical protein
MFLGLIRIDLIKRIKQRLQSYEIISTNNIYTAYFETLNVRLRGRCHEINFHIF